MSATATIRRETTVELTAADIAAAWCDLDDDAQAQFFVEAAKIMRGWPIPGRAPHPGPAHRRPPRHLRLLERRRARARGRSRRGHGARAGGAAMTAPVPCVYCHHEPHTGRCAVHMEAEVEIDDDTRCGCPTYRSEPLPPISLADLERRLSGRRDRLKRLEALGARCPEVILTWNRDLLEQVQREIRERRGRGTS